MPSKDWIKRNKERHLAYMRKHGSEYAKKYPWHRTYHLIKARCNNPKSSNFRYYGGRGIRCLISKEEVKSLWIRDSAKLMEKPSIDRINNDDHYIYKNCRFIELSDNISKKNMRTVNKFNINEDFMRTYDSMKDASIDICGQERLQTGISACARNVQRTAGGYKWSYAK